MSRTRRPSFRWSEGIDFGRFGRRHGDLSRVSDGRSVGGYVVRGPRRVVVFLIGKDYSESWPATFMTITAAKKWVDARAKEVTW